jgi:hypothetical protein
MPEAPLEAPDATYTRQRWVQRRTVDWVHEADSIMLEHGAVVGTGVLEHRYQARWRAQRLIRLMVELRLHERWELKEHTERRPAGWGWSVEYVGGANG